MNRQLTCSQCQWLHSSVGRASHQKSRGHGFKPRWSPEFCSGFFTQLHKLRSLRRSFLYFHFISAVHIWYISYIIILTKSFLSLICFRKLWLWNPGAYWSRNKVWPNHWYLWHGFLCGPWSSWIQCGKEKKSQGSRGISTQDYQGRVHEVVPAEGMSKALNNLYILWGVTVVCVNLIEGYNKQ